MVVVCMVILFAIMIFSSISARDVSNKQYDRAHTFSMGSAILAGVTVLLLGIVLIIHINSESVIAAGHNVLNKIGSQ